MAITSLPKTIAALQTVALGQNGADWIDDTAAHVGDWAIVVATADATFTLLTTTTVYLNGAAAPTNLNGKTLLKGLPLYGRFTAITLQSGGVMAYRTGEP